MARCLLDNGANLEATDIDGETPLHYAIDFGRVEMARYLLEDRDADKLTRLHKAEGNKDIIDIAQLLLTVVEPLRNEPNMNHDEKEVQ